MTHTEDQIEILLNMTQKEKLWRTKIAFTKMKTYYIYKSGIAIMLSIIGLFIGAIMSSLFLASIICMPILFIFHTDYPESLEIKNASDGAFFFISFISFAFLSPQMFFYFYSYINDIIEKFSQEDGAFWDIENF